LSYGRNKHKNNSYNSTIISDYSKYHFFSNWYFYFREISFNVAASKTNTFEFKTGRHNVSPYSIVWLYTTFCHLHGFA